MNQLLPKLTEHGADDRSEERAAAADRRPDDRLDRIGRREFTGIDDADLRHVERAGEPGDQAETVKAKSLKASTR